MGKHYLKTAIAACLIMSAMIGGTMGFGFFMDPVTSDLGFDRSAFSLYFSLVTIVGTITLPIYGRIMAKVGPRPCVIIGGAWTGVAMAALSLCDSLPMFYAVGCLIGLGFFGCSYVAVPVIVSNWFVEKNGLVMGSAAACGGVICMVMSFVLPSLIQSMGWGTGYVALGAFVFVLTVPVGLLLLRSKPADVELEPYGAAFVREGASTAGSTAELPGVAYRDALRMPQLYLIVAAFLIYLITVSVTQHLAAYFTSVGFDALTAGLFMSVISIGMIFTNAAAGTLSDKLGLMKTMALCSVLFAAGFVLLPASMAFALICVALVLLSIGNAFTSVLAPVVTGLVFGQRDYSSLWGVVSMACVLGQAIGAPLWGLVYDFTGGYELGMYVSAVLVVIAFLIVWSVARSRATNGA